MVLLPVSRPRLVVYFTYQILLMSVMAIVPAAGKVIQKAAVLRIGDEDTEHRIAVEARLWLMLVIFLVSLFGAPSFEPNTHTALIQSNNQSMQRRRFLRSRDAHHTCGCIPYASSLGGILGLG